MSGINYQPSDKEILQTHIHNTDEKYKVGLDKGQQTVFFLLLFLHHSAKVFKMSLFSTKNPVTDSPVIDTRTIWYWFSYYLYMLLWAVVLIEEDLNNNKTVIWF